MISVSCHLLEILVLLRYCKEMRCSLLCFIVEKKSWKRDPLHMPSVGSCVASDTISDISISFSKSIGSELKLTVSFSALKLS